MIKKVLSYQMMLNYNLLRCNQAGKSQEGRFFSIFLFFFFVGSGLSTHKSSIWIGLFLVLCYMGAEMIANHTSRMLRMIPVSDEFAVANMMFLFPIKVVGQSAIGIFIVMSILQTLMERNLNWILGFKEINITGCLFSFMIAAGVWFWWCLGAFHRNVVKRRIWYIAEFVVYIGSIKFLSEVMQHKGIYVAFAVSDLIEVFPMSMR